MADDNILNLTVDIVSAHVSNNSVATADLPTLINSVYGALVGMSAPAPVETPKQAPAVSIRSSVKPEYLVCLEDGKQVKMLKRYLATNYSLTPAEYRAKWNLPADYPMVAPNYAERRRELAHKIGLGRKASTQAMSNAPMIEAPVSEVTKTPRKKLGIARTKSETAAPTAETPPLEAAPKVRAPRKPREKATPA